jgi:hypothetical protein
MRAAERLVPKQVRYPSLCVNGGVLGVGGGLNRC